MSHVTLSVDDDIHDDLRECKKQLGVDMSTVLTQLYKGWRNGTLAISTLPDGTKINGPLTKR